jgi:hypothetical protein
MKLNIACKGSGEAHFEDFKIIQGSLKELSTENFDKLKKQIITLGFSAPIFVWKPEKSNKLHVVDGTQRLRVLSVLKEEGYEIPPIPYAEIEAKDEREAAEKLLAFVSQYGKTTTDGLYEFINNFDIDPAFLNDLSIPDFSMDAFNKGYVADEAEAPEESALKDERKCPHCGKNI